MNTEKKNTNLKREGSVPDSNPSSSEMVDILIGCRTIAIVGLSDQPNRTSYRVGSYLKQKGYRVIPVNPFKNEIMGEKCYPDLYTIPEHVDIVDIFRDVEAIPGIVEEAIGIGAGIVWMQLGLVQNEAAQKARKAGLCVVQSRCLMVEHEKLLGQS
ncbi:MAG: CoA-binding protein [Smithella sp.]